MHLLILLSSLPLHVLAIPTLPDTPHDPNPVGLPFQNAVLPIPPELGFTPHYSLLRRQGCPNLTLRCSSGTCCGYDNPCCGSTCCASGYVCSGGTASAPCCVAIGSLSNSCGSGNPCSRPGDLPCQGINICCPPSNACYFDTLGVARCSPLGGGATPTPAPRYTPAVSSNYYYPTPYSYPDYGSSSSYSYRYSTSSTSSYGYGGSGGSTFSSSDYSSSSRRRTSPRMIAGAVVGGIVAAVIVVFAVWWIIRRCWRPPIPPPPPRTPTPVDPIDDDAKIIDSLPADFQGPLDAKHIPILYPQLQKGDIRVLEVLEPEYTKPGIEAGIVCRLWVHTVEPQGAQQIPRRPIPGQGQVTGAEVQSEKPITKHWPGYEALSYVWAQQPRNANEIGKRAMITVINPQRPDVRAKFVINWNLNEALKFFRREDGSRILWTDQICINQCEDRMEPQEKILISGQAKKPSEKMTQVMMMKTIYASADQVQVWLGPSIPESREAARYFAPFDGKTLTDDELMQSYRSAQRSWENLFDGFQNRPWWSRAWIVQEVICTPNPMLNSGPDALSLNVVLRLLKFALKAQINLINDKSLINRSSRFPVLEMVAMRDQVKLGTQHLSVWLFTFHNQSATNPRDRIFAYTGLSYHALNWPQQTDYESKVGDVWAEGTRLALYMSNSYDFICLGRGADWGLPGEYPNSTPANPEDRNRTEALKGDLDLPSWVPNYRVNEGDGETSASTLPLRYCHLANSAYDACGSLRTISWTNGWKELEVLGVFVDKIKRVSGINFSSIPGADGEAFMSEAFKMFREEFSRCSESCSSISCTHYPGPRGGSYPIAFSKSLVMDLDFHGRRLKPEYGFNTLHHRLDKIPGDFKPTVTDIVARKKLWMEHLYKQKSRWSNWRRFIITEKGYLGMAHRDCRPGDSIYVVGSATIPFVLREFEPATFGKEIDSATGEQDRRVKFVGESYVHGFMDGEIHDGTERTGIGMRLVMV